MDHKYYEKLASIIMGTACIAIIVSFFLFISGCKILIENSEERIINYIETTYTNQETPVE